MSVGTLSATPRQLAETLLLRKACLVLAFTRAPDAAIAYRLGFDDAAYFWRFLTRGTGLSPTIYRLKLQTER